jgi:hypothetical protein
MTHRTDADAYILAAKVAQFLAAVANLLLALFALRRVCR